MCGNAGNTRIDCLVAQLLGMLNVEAAATFAQEWAVSRRWRKPALRRVPCRQFQGKVNVHHSHSRSSGASNHLFDPSSKVNGNQFELFKCCLQVFDDLYGNHTRCRQVVAAGQRVVL